MRLATFDLSQVDTDDERAVEKSWNDFVDGLRLQGLRPSDEAFRWTGTSTTYRVFELGLEDEQAGYTLDFDIAKLGRVATTVALVGVLLSTMVDKAGWAADVLAGVAA